MGDVVSEGVTLGQFLEYAGRITTVAAVLGFIVGLKLGWWVMRSELDAVKNFYTLLLSERDARIKRLEDTDAKWSELLTRLVEPILPARRRG